MLIERIEKIKKTNPDAGYRKIAEILGVSPGKVRYALNKNSAPNNAPERTNDAVNYAVNSAVWDIETTNLRSDIGSLMVVAFFDLTTGETESKTIDEFQGTHSQRERQLVLWAKEKYSAYDIIVGHNSQAFDKNFVNGVLARHGEAALPLRFQIDTYQVARNGFKGIPQSYSLANLLDFFQLPIEKDKPSKHSWREGNSGDADAVERLRQRCEMDVKGNALLWGALKPYFQAWKGR